MKLNKKQIIKNTAEYVKSKMTGEGSGHDWWHVYRVWRNAKNIGKQEKADMFVAELGALLHDIADYKLHGGDDNIGPKVARKWLEKQNVDEEDICHVCEIIRITYYDINFQKNFLKNKIKTKEAAIVWDADKLDASGAMGIARVFAYGGSKGREIYNPDIKIAKYNSFKEYKNQTSTSINHFYEKLLLLKGLMNTKTGKKMAEERHKFLKQYLDRFFKEWNGKL